MAHRITPALAALSAATLLATGCGTVETAGTAGTGGPSGPVVVATTTWQGAFARAAGAQNVTVIVPASTQHAPEYDPKPSDLAAVAEADFVLYSPFESFAEQITGTAGSGAQVVEVDVDNSPDVVEREVDRLGALFGTREAATAWLDGFAAARQEITADLRKRWPRAAAPTAVTQVYTRWAAELAGAKVVETYGPEQLTAAEVAVLARARPEFVFENTHMSAGRVLPDSAAVQIGVVNYPDEDLDLIALYRSNAEAIGAALQGGENSGGDR